LFGGYRRYVPFANYDFFKASAFVKRSAGILKNMVPPAGDKKSMYYFLHRLASLASKSGLQIYLSAGVDIVEDFENNIINPPFHYLGQMEKDFDAVAASDMSSLKKIMQLDFDINLFNDLLVKMDIANMANSLEGRSPFLSKELLEYAPGINDNFKIKGKTTKYLLRQLSKKYLPTTLVGQPKRGFEIPLKNWVDNQLKGIIYDYLGSSNAISRQFVNPYFIDGLLNNKANVPAEKRAKILWTLFSLEVWHKKVYLSNPA